jgi:hypothetical protein
LLGRSGSAEQRAAVRALLSDADPRVRLRAAQGLAAGRDKEGIPVLIALLNEGPLDLAEQADDVLNCIGLTTAGPCTTLNDNPAHRRRCQTAWDSWWKAFGKNLDLAHADADLPPFNPLLQTRTVTRRFVSAVSRRDLAAFQQVTALPFVVANVQTCNTRDALDRFCGNLFPQQGEQIATFTFGRTMSAERYARSLSKDQKAALAALLKPENSVVLVQGTLQDQPQSFCVFVRSTDGQAHVIGILPGDRYRPLQ